MRRPLCAAGLLMAFALHATAQGVPVVWTESSLTAVLPEARPARTSETSIRLYAARGEWESFQVCIHGTRGDRRVMAVEGEPHAALGVPTVHRVGFVALAQPSPRAITNAPLWPDRLLPFEPFTVPEGETRSLWVSYFVPRSAPAGIHQATLRIQLDPGRVYLIEVSIEVFDWAVPEVPSFRTLLGMDWHRLGRTRAQRSLPELADDTYRRLGPYRVGYPVFVDEPPATPGVPRALALTDIQRALSRAHALGQLPALELGAGRPLAARWPMPGLDGAPDPLQHHLREMGEWLGDRGWKARAVARPAPMAPRGQWDALRAEYIRVRTATSGISRMVEAPFHPFFERLAEVWAVPYDAYDPAAHDRLNRGLSLDDGLAVRAERVTASSSAPPPRAPRFPADPRDAYDGSPFTAWHPARPPRPGAPQWLEIVLDEPVLTQEFTITWPAGAEGTDLSVRTSFDGRAFSTVTVDWRQQWAGAPYAPSYTVGRFRMERQIRAIRITIGRPARGEHIAVAEVSFAAPPEDITPRLVNPPEVWFTPGGAFPSFAPDAPPFEARLFPWLAWPWGVRGLTGLPLNEWPLPLPRADEADPELLAWPGPEPPLLYPSDDGWLPSIRLERLRDGIEDYEYLAAATRLAQSEDPMADAFSDVLPHAVFWTAPNPDALAAFTTEALDARVAIGRLLTRHAQQRPTRSP